MTQLNTPTTVHTLLCSHVQRNWGKKRNENKKPGGRGSKRQRENVRNGPAEAKMEGT